MSFAINPADAVGTKLNAAAVEAQRILFAAAPVDGNLVMSYGGSAFTNLLFSSISAANLQAKLRTITALAAVTVVENAAYDYDVRMVGVANNPLMIVDASTALKSAVLTEAEGVLNLTADVTLAKVSGGAANNARTLTLQVLAAASNPAATVLAAFTGTAAAIVCTITPNDGTNNLATPVGLTTAELAELITSGLVAGKTVTVTDVSSLRALQTATGGGATALADAGEGDGVVATFSGGLDSTLSVITVTQEIRGR